MKFDTYGSLDFQRALFRATEWIMKLLGPPSPTWLCHLSAAPVTPDAAASGRCRSSGIRRDKKGSPVVNMATLMERVTSLEYMLPYPAVWMAAGGGRMRSMSLPWSHNMGAIVKHLIRGNGEESRHHSLSDRDDKEATGVVHVSSISLRLTFNGRSVDRSPFISSSTEERIPYKMKFFARFAIFSDPNDWRTIGLVCKSCYKKRYIHGGLSSRALSSSGRNGSG
ncbi:hypothetical protein AAG570_004480 [Ranatra chinensis]|uniref:Uncharacterized protein n=1 Tax=Ranatra chinensis TaxID=642074 RepID=A0ABD0YDM2_9HEMI